MCAMVFSGRNYETSSWIFLDDDDDGVFNKTTNVEMPQTVPSAGFTPPCDYNSFATDSFDLSLLPYCDSEVPYSSFNLLYYDLTGSPPPMFPAPQQTSDPKKPQQPPQVKEEPYSSSYLLPPAPTGPYPAPPPASPAGSTTSSTYTNNSSPYQQCPSPSSSRLLPAIKHEQTIDLQEILQESRFLQETVSEKVEKKPDHQLLREVLKDTSFQRKYNIKPLDLEGLSAAAASSSSTCDDRVKAEQAIAPSCSGSSKQEAGDGGGGSSGGAGLVDKIEPVLSMAIEQLRMDVNNTCSVLGISSDLSQWTVDDVKAWLLWTLRQYNLPMIQMEYFSMDGVALSALTEEEFQKRAPECGSTLYAQLEIWKAACSELDSHMDLSGILQWNSSNNSSSSSGDISEDEEEEEPEAAAPSGGKVPSSRSSGGSGGSHIHLWQFLKELLSAPQLHGSCIRWLDRSKGVFKIEDSVRVARLWGKRKNRPAMNYDKLSRSIRQYYKKGIMKKTERSQRLVYQFCHPYCL